MKIVICGGGISGLYSALLLSRFHSDLDITIIESSNRLGGRIKSFVDGDIKYEIGAGRFSSKHDRLMRLIGDCHLDSCIKPIKSSHSYFIGNTFLENDSELLKYFGIRKSFRQLWKSVASDYITWSNLGRKSLPFILQREYDAKTADALSYHIGYQDILRLDPKITIKTLLDSYDILREYQFNTLDGGLEQLIKCITSELKRRKVKIRLSTQLEDIKPFNKGYFIITDNDILEADYVFITMTRNTCQNIPFLRKHMAYSLKHIIPLPLMRIYAVFDKPWFKGLNSIITDLPIEYFIPINPHTGLTMISYVDYKNVEYMRRHIQKGDLQKTIMTQIRHMMTHIKHIVPPEPISLEYYDWTEGIHGYRPNTNWDYIHDDIEELAKQHIYIAGEMVSQSAQGWIEGALETAELAVNRFRLQVGGASISLADIAKNKWIAIRGKVFDVSGFISKHPGGANIYKGIGKEHTTLWNKTHSDAIYNSHLATEENRKKYGIKLIGTMHTS